ncbi:hypothetical protein GGR57DRAFT_215745 [Xylariaceae sp. FL1272]|nr:hypothetical protein GGR57DRAFT_215745 [Xylariaceae sp. FL1272]
MAEEPRSKKVARLDRIDIWRNEVANSQVFCVCSAPAMSEREYQSPVTVSTVPTNQRSRFLQRDLRPRPRDVQASDGTGQKTLHCPICDLPNDSVVYESLNGDGKGLVRRSVSPRSASSVQPIESESKIGSRKQSLIRAITYVFRPHRGLGLPRHSDSQRGTGTPLLKLDSESAERGSVSPTTDKLNLASSTNMYHLLRRDVQNDGIPPASEGTLLSEDLERKKPRLAIEESAARLERANLLLNKSADIGTTS